MIIVRKNRFVENGNPLTTETAVKPEDKIHEMIYWMKERQRMYRRRFDEKLPPEQWTEDPILKMYRFCNVFRELDKVTIWIRENWREKFDGHPHLPFAMCIARLFNEPTSLEAIGFPEVWDPEGVKARLHKIHDTEKVFNPAYMISNVGEHKNKIDLVVEDYLTPMFDNLPMIDSRSLKNSHQILRGYDGIGDFIAYEVVTDLRHTSFLRNAKDIMTWANPGPGAKRGLNRVFGREVGESLTSFQANEEMQNLLRICKEALYHEDPMFADLEMRDIEHSLCETDKYLRAKVDGRPLKQLYGIAQSARRRTVANGSRYPTMLDQVKSKLIDSGKDVFTKEELFTIIQEIKDLGSYRRQLAEAKAKAANPSAEPLPEIPIEDEVIDG